MKEAILEVLSTFKDMDRADWKIVGSILSISTGITGIIVGLLILVVYIYGGF